MEMDFRTKEILLRLLNRFVEVCHEQGLKYYLAGGSVLGAIRHHGMIPWDDDIDVFMPRNDYERIQLLPNGAFGPGLRLASWKRTKNYKYDFLKLESLNTTVLERFHPKYVGGVFLDIFPVDSFSSTEVNLSLIDQIVSSFQNKIVECVIKNDNDCKTLLELLLLKIRRLCYNHSKNVNGFEEFITSLGGKEDDMMADFHNYFYCHGGWPARYFGEGIPMLFEGNYFNVPENWDGYLTHVYGNYMTPPPPEKRYGHHFEYVNYERRLSDTEIRKEWKRIHKKYAYHFSLKKELKSILKVLHLR